MAAFQLRKLRHRSYEGTVEDAARSNAAHLDAAAAVDTSAIPRVPLPRSTDWFGPAEAVRTYAS